MDIVSNLRESLETGFIVHSHESLYDYQPQLVVNKKNENKKILGIILQELKRCKSFNFSVAFLTMSGFAVLVNTLEYLKAKGIKGQVLVSQYQNFTHPDALNKLMAFENVVLKIVTKGDFHAKGYIFEHKDHYSLIIGSSNLTASALTSNKEWNLRVAAMRKAKIVLDTLYEFDKEFESATAVTPEYIKSYQSIYKAQKQFAATQRKSFEAISAKSIIPNEMQKNALDNLTSLRKEGKDKALLISATGTGKTYLSAFDVAAVNPKRLLFLVHRANIAHKALESYLKIMPEKSMGIFSGAHKEIEKDYVFSTVQTISRDENLFAIAAEHFDYIVIDETHRAGAITYQKILKHLKPKFLLGMTATPERTDGFDIFKQFDYNIAYEIRLHRALDEEMLCPFHYFGVTDVVVDNAVVGEDAAFLKLVSEERINHIIERSQWYGCDNGDIRGLVFCNSNKVSLELSKAFNERGLKSVALSGESSESEREKAIELLESDDPAIKLDYIFSVDIFNEGIDIPKVNQIIMLRPTQSAIVFVQQLGRGLRKTNGKSYLTVIDFIGNYNNNYLVPIALYGDSSYNKDNLRKLIAGESDGIPGSSTVNFERIAKERIYAAIDQAKMNLKRDLISDYDLLKYKLGKIPMMMDFLKHGSRDAFLYVEASHSYFNFVEEREAVFPGTLSAQEKLLLGYISRDLANGKRIEEVVCLQLLLDSGNIQLDDFKVAIYKKYGYLPSDKTIQSVLQNINFLFVTENSVKEGSANKTRKISVGDKYGFNLVIEAGKSIIWHPFATKLLANDTFVRFTKDVLEYARATYENGYDLNRYIGGFMLYRKYSRKDVFRILNWEENPVAQNVGGYIVSPDKTNCPIFVNYNKAEDISDTTKYEDAFISNVHFTWFSKSKRTISSPDVQSILKHKENNMRIPLFIKKSNDEGLDFYYLGDLAVIEGRVSEERMPTSDGKSVSVVKMQMQLSVPVAPALYVYITGES